MKPCGVILTYMGREDFIGKTLWVKLRTAFFNCKLFVGQLFFMIAGTAIGKIKWEKQFLIVQMLCIVGVMVTTTSMVVAFIASNWYLFSFHAMAFIYFTCYFRNIDWRRVWRAAQCSHVRLCLEKHFDYFRAKLGELERSMGLPSLRDGHSFQYINFGYPEAKMDYWRIDQCKGKRFEYRGPTFDPSPEFIAAMIEYAEAQVGKRYDTAQLFSFGLNFIVWLFWWPLWGREVFRWLNLRGGREVCSSGVTACLRWVENKRMAGSYMKKMDSGRYQGFDGFNQSPVRVRHHFFFSYDTAMVPPCLIAINRNWRRDESRTNH